MAARKKFQDMIVHHRNMEVKLTYKDGFAPTWEAYVKWPGYKNRKYFTSVSAWNHLPSTAIDVVNKRIDIRLGLAHVDVLVADFGTKTYKIKSLTNEGNYVFEEKDLEGNWLRFNTKENRVEVNDPAVDGKWDVYISDASIVQVDFWNVA